MSNMQFDFTVLFQVYAMSKKIRGQCLIVNNEKFDRGEDREGSAVDAANLEFLFGKLGFQVPDIDTKFEVINVTYDIFSSEPSN